MIQYCIARASELKYEKGKQRLFACITDKKGRVVSESANSYTCSHPKQYYAAMRVGRPNAIYLHAEIAALVKSKGKGCKLYVARVNRLGVPMLATPCEICSMAIQMSGHIKSVEYSI